MKQYAIVIDADRCIGCRGGCQVACKMEHDIALGPSRSKLYTVGPTGRYPDLEMYFMPVMCQQCAEPKCAEVCPTGACHKSDSDGVVYIDKELCIGCQSCMKACPYDAILFNNELRVADKCDICASLRAKGEKPACVRNCSGAAIFAGDINDIDSEIARLVAAAGEDAHTLRDERGAMPSGRFILRRTKWVDARLEELCEQGGKANA